MPRFFDVTRTRLRGAGPRVGRWGRSPSQPPRFAASRPLLPFAVARLRRFAAAAPLRGRPASPRSRPLLPFAAAPLRRFAAAAPLRSRPASPRSRPQRSLGSSASSPLRGRCSPSQPPRFAAFAAAAVPWQQCVFAASRPLFPFAAARLRRFAAAAPSQSPGFAASRPLFPFAAARLRRFAAAAPPSGPSAWAPLGLGCRSRFRWGFRCRLRSGPAARPAGARPERDEPPTRSPRPSSPIPPAEGRSSPKATEPRPLDARGPARGLWRRLGLRTHLAPSLPGGGAPAPIRARCPRS